MSNSNNTFATTQNYVPIPLGDIPIISYEIFYNNIKNSFAEETNHCVNYFGTLIEGEIQMFCCIADDKSGEIHVYSFIYEGKALLSLSKTFFAFHVFERELHEQFGIEFEEHPWLKPIRFETNSRFGYDIENYPFFKIESEHTHQVGVGPVHAGIIEPGHFRFHCKGEEILHLEIQLGYQHRGVEKVFIEKNQIFQRNILAENIAGDTVIGHATTFCVIAEQLSNTQINEKLIIERTIALEYERVAMHLSDVAGICTDVAYQFGKSVVEPLRTLTINSFINWCGNRFGKGLIRVGGTNYSLNESIIKKLYSTIVDVEERFDMISDRLFNLPGMLSRLDNLGKISLKQAESCGFVGLSAKMAGLERDIRQTHPYLYYKNIKPEFVAENKGDLLARLYVRTEEVKNSITYIKELFEILLNNNYKISNKPVIGNINYIPNALIVGLNEGWRGEICHTAITNMDGNIVRYKIKDPSLHNWMALALCVRNLEISDFPLCNKSFDLSYCGNDL
ncbi:MAG: hypothetical protein A2X02_10390 [Bacteroidetes bacterium GWF2_29_10]|nr:MAG: hypothetical protein A2X02_10390 [Bacteroidetes bacterium GWF2_29_10]